MQPKEKTRRISGGSGRDSLLLPSTQKRVFQDISGPGLTPAHQAVQVPAPFEIRVSPDRTSQAALAVGVTPKSQITPDGSHRLWIPPGSQVEIHGYELPDGMIYVGSHLGQVSGNGIEPALINPNLPVLNSSELYRGEEIRYWPSYSNLSLNARGLYLKWLAGGRQDPSVSMGIVYLFFFGLERRLLAETNAVTDSEGRVLIQEIERLLTIYGGMGLFRDYARDLRGFVKVPQWEKCADDIAAKLEKETFWRINLGLSVTLGKMAAAGEALSAKWAFKWLRSVTSYYPRTTAQRCGSEFARLFEIRYGQKFGKGLKLKPCKRKIQMQYKPASPSFCAESLTQAVELPDVTTMDEPVKQLRELASACLSELDGYSRFLGRNPAQRSSIMALVLLPEDLLREQKNDRLTTVTAWLNRTLDGKAMATTGYWNLAAEWPEIHREHYRKQDALTLAECLEKLGFGIEPDVRFGSDAPAHDGSLVLFKLVAGALNNPSNQMSTALLTLRLGAMVLAASEINDSDSEGRLVENLSAAFHLGPPEEQRLRAKLRWLLVSKPSTFRDKKRIELLDLNQRTTIARFLVGVTGAVGHISPSSVEALEKVYRLLGLDSKSLYSELQGIATSPITVQIPDSDRRGYVIPAPPKRDGQTGRIEIDIAKVDAMRAETEQISNILQNIFAEQDETPLTGGVSPSAQGSILGLSPAQSAFLRTLVTKTSWSREEAEDLANAHHVLLNGAIDAINEKTLDNFGEPLLEGNERIEVNSAALKELGL